MRLGKAVLAIAVLSRIACGEPLSCKVHPIAPWLTFRMAYRAGFTVSAPLSQFTGGELRLTVRVTPKQEGGRPLVLSDTTAVQSASKGEVEIRDEFYLGAGEYRAEMELSDDRQRVCRESWDVSLKPAGQTPIALGPGQLAALTDLESPRPGARPGRLTVFLNAGLQSDDETLLASLQGIVERLRFREVQVVVFSLAERKVLLRKQVKEAADFSAVQDALREYSASTVSYDALKQGQAYRDFLWPLLAGESPGPERVGVALFLGFSTLDDSHMSAPPECREGSKPAYAYLRFRKPAVRRATWGSPGDRLSRSRMSRSSRPGPQDQMAPEPDYPDAISRMTRACSGKVFVIGSPADLETALAKLGE
jgi:hypothetical protein